MSVKSERKRTKKAQKQAAAKKGAAKKTETENRYVSFVVARVDGVDRIVRTDDPECEAFIKELQAVPSERRLPAGNHWNLFMLYENGRAVPYVEPKDDADPILKSLDNFNAEFQERLESQYYDQAFPERAADVKKFVQQVLQQINEATNVPFELPEDASINPEYLASVVRQYLEETKLQITEGKSQTVVGWGTDKGMFAITTPGGLPHKYRSARAVSEIAAIINAPFIFIGSEAWFRNAQDERTGEEALMANVILPDGTIASQGVMKFRRKPLKFDETMESPKDWQGKQSMFPKWAYFKASTERAVA